MQRPLTPERDLFLLRSIHADIVAGTHPIYRLPAHALMTASEKTIPTTATPAPQLQQQPVIMTQPQHQLQHQQLYPQPVQQFSQYLPHAAQPVIAGPSHPVPVVSPVPRPAFRYGDLDQPSAGYAMYEAAGQGLPYGNGNGNGNGADGRQDAPIGKVPLAPAPGFPTSIAFGHHFVQPAPTPPPFVQQQYQLDPRQPPQSYS